MRPRQNARRFQDAIFKWIFVNENAWISNKISLKFVLNGPINNIPSLVQIMAWWRPGIKPLYKPVMVSFKDAHMRHSVSMSYKIVCSNRQYHSQISFSLKCPFSTANGTFDHKYAQYVRQSIKSNCIAIYHLECCVEFRLCNPDCVILITGSGWKYILQFCQCGGRRFECARWRLMTIS